MPKEEKNYAFVINVFFINYTEVLIPQDNKNRMKNKKII